jgi:D-glycero-alpha-D-manno-heptose-7-phosphate kinase
MLIRSKAPLRLGFAGGGTDVSPYSDEYGGYVLNATIDMYAYCTIEVTDNNQVTFVAADRNEIFQNEAHPKFELNGLLDLHKVAYNRIVSEFNNHQPLSFKMTTYSDAPAGSGLGASSTVVVTMLKAFQEWLDLPLGDYDLAHLAYEVERIDAGLIGGKQDQYAATFGGFNFMEFYENDRVIVNPLRVKQWILNELEDSMVLFYTGTSRDSAKIINEQIKNTQTRNEKSLNAMHELKEDALRMKEVLLKGDIPKLGEYLGKTWKAKKQMAQPISNEFIDQIYNAAIDAGAYSGKVSGAGGGGFMIFLVDPTKKLRIVKALNQFNGKVLNAHFTKNGTFGWCID